MTPQEAQMQQMYLDRIAQMKTTLLLAQMGVKILREQPAAIIPRTACMPDDQQ